MRSFGKKGTVSPTTEKEGACKLRRLFLAENSSPRYAFSGPSSVLASNQGSAITNAVDKEGEHYHERGMWGRES